MSKNNEDNEGKVKPNTRSIFFIYIEEENKELSKKRQQRKQNNGCVQQGYNISVKNYGKEFVHANDKANEKRDNSEASTSHGQNNKSANTSQLKILTIDDSKHPFIQKDPKQSITQK